VKPILNRRKFFGVTMAATALVSSYALVEPLLASPQVETKVFQILRTHLHLADEHRELVSAFCLSLQSSPHHIPSPNKVGGAVGGDQERQQLEAYVLQEFFVTTNYLEHFRAGSPLRMLDTRALHRPA